MDGEVKFLGDMEKLTLDERDVLVVTLADAVSAERLESISVGLKAKFNHNRVVVLPSGISVGVIQKPNFSEKTA